MTDTYVPRIVDSALREKLEAFGAVHIVGPKWCGKTMTAKQTAKSSLMLQNRPDKERLIQTAELNPSVLLNGEQPRLIDEWQDAPQIWDAVRSYCDDHPGTGHFILTGSTSKKTATYHTGTGRISKLKMYPMSLFESKESNGTVSLKKLFDGTETLENGCHSDLTIEQLIFSACRGGWPASIDLNNPKAQLSIPKDYCSQISEADMFQVDDVKRNKATMRAVLQSYARNISTLAKTTNIAADVSATNRISDRTLEDYISVLETLFVVEDLYGWCPAIRTPGAIRSGRKREFVDPSLAVAALDLSPEILNTDLKTFGFIFETLCIRDLRIYSSALGGTLSYYHDRHGLEADVVLHLANGKYALIEIKLGGRGVDEGAKHLLKIEELIKKHNEAEPEEAIREPDLKIVLTGGEYGMRRPDGVFEIPIGCIRD